MKTELNSIKQFRTAILLFGVCIVLSFACKQATSSFETSEDEVSIEELSINVKYAESYDQTVTTFSRLWPEGVSAEFGKGKASSGGELLVDYERTREILAFDENGYMSTVSEFLEGDGEMNMPEEAFNEFKSSMPARSNDYDPVVKTVMEGGKTFMYGKSGKLKYQFDYDPKDYKASVDELDSLKAWQDQNQDTENSIKRTLKSLNQEGINFDRVGDFHVTYNLEAELDEQEKGLLVYQYTDDLRTGLTAQLVVLRTDGNYESIVRSKYQIIDNVPMLALETRYSFGDVNGKWGITYRQRMTRENIKLVRN